MTEETLIACSHPINKVDISKEPKIRGPRVSPRLPPVPCNDNAKACLSGNFLAKVANAGAWYIEGPMPPISIDTVNNKIVSE